MSKTPQDLTRQLFNRLRYIEGQAQGIRRMLLGERAGTEVLVQLRAIESAAAGARELYLRHLVEAELRDGFRERILAHMNNCPNGADLLALVAGQAAEESVEGRRQRRRRPAEGEVAEQGAG